MSDEITVHAKAREGGRNQTALSCEGILWWGLYLSGPLALKIPILEILIHPMEDGWVINQSALAMTPKRGAAIQATASATCILTGQIIFVTRFRPWISGIRSTNEVEQRTSEWMRMAVLCTA
jgi:hypothetical protein